MLLDNSVDLYMMACVDLFFLQVATAVNNHYDTDGLLSVYALLFPEEALKYRKLLPRAPPPPPPTSSFNIT